MKIYTKQSLFPNNMAVGRTVDGGNPQVKATCQYLTEV